MRKLLIILVWFTSLLMGGEKMGLHIYSPAFEEDGIIPSKYTCEGADISPPLEWSGVSSEAKSMVLIVDDPDAPDPKAPKMTWVHWVVYDIPPTVHGFEEGIKYLPSGSKEGLNDWKRTGYGGPCPPIGRHRYFFKLYALDTSLKFSHIPTKAEVEAAMMGHILQAAELMGTFEKE